jgi:3-octaprenyl-4-hydroxybenzoate carboxy-lyase N-terminal domain
MSTLSNSPYTLDLRGFIEFLEAEHPEPVIRISKEVDPKFGVSGILERLERDGRFPMVIFENVKGSKIPLVANMHASFERLRLGMEKGGVKEFAKECAARQANPIDQVMVETGPVHEVICVGNDVDVDELPICTYHATYCRLHRRVLADLDRPGDTRGGAGQLEDNIEAALAKKDRPRDDPAASSLHHATGMCGRRTISG